MIDYLRKRLAKALEEAFCIPMLDAKKFTTGFLEEVRKEVGGDEVYIAKRDKEELRRRVLTMFDGRNHDAVCEACEISRATLYRYLGERGHVQISEETTS